MKTELVRELMQTILQTRASFKLAIQRGLRENKIGITYEMLQIMVCLWNHEGVNQQMLADKTFKDKASLTYLINNLEARGFVERQEDALDRRNKKIVLTPQGYDLRVQIQPLLNEIYASSAENMDENSILEAISFLQKANDAFKKTK